MYEEDDDDDDDGDDHDTLQILSFSRLIKDSSTEH